MKSCPACLTRYTDDTLKYCLQDGTPLVASLGSAVPTVNIGETETLVKPLSGESQLDTRPDLSYPRPEPRSKLQRSRSNTALVVAITAIVMLIVFGALGLAGFLYLRDQDPDERADTNRIRSGNFAENKDSAPPQTPPPTPRVENDRASDSGPPADRKEPSPVNSQTREEVTRQINSWRSQTEAMDVDSLMTQYASRVDYYNKRGAGIDFIRADKNRAFSRYSEIRLNLSNFAITTNDSEDSVTAVFDKEWRFRGDRNSTGKVRQLLKLRKIAGQWLITAERDLKVY